MLNRRSLLATATAAGLAAPFGREAYAAAMTPVAMPAPGQFEKNEDAYWATLRKQFLMPADLVNLNNGTVGSSPARC
jgi:isopenicillin-N epimerase